MSWAEMDLGESPMHICFAYGSMGNLFLNYKIYFPVGFEGNKMYVMINYINILPFQLYHCVFLIYNTNQNYMYQYWLAKFVINTSGAI